MVPDKPYQSKQISSARRVQYSHTAQIGTPCVAVASRPGQDGSMQAASFSDRRRAPRIAGEGMVCLSMAATTAKARLTDYSDGGLRMVTRAKLERGEILYCAVPALPVCTRARVVHVKRGWLRRTVGLEFLATLSDFA
jgi:hypothetical protein